MLAEQDPGLDVPALERLEERALEAPDEAGRLAGRPGHHARGGGAGDGVAALAGSPNLGTALTFGQLAFALALVFVLLKR